MTIPLYRLLPILGIWWELSALTLASPYDEYMTCGANTERYGRKYHTHYYDAPCDLSVETFCLTPGQQYPWSSVRRFVHENQGLIKRMYGNQRHYNVLRSEVLHDMYEEMFDEMPTRQTHRFQPSATISTSRTGRYQKHSNANLVQEERTKLNRNEEDPNTRSRSIKTISMEPDYIRKKGVGASLPEISAKLKAQHASGNRLKDMQDEFDQLAMDILETVADLTASGKNGNPSTESPHTTQTSSAPTDPTVLPVTGETTTGRGYDWLTEDDVAAEATTPRGGLTSYGKGSEEEREWEKMRPTYLPLPDFDELGFPDDGIWTTLEDDLFDAFSTTTYSPEFDEFSMSTMPEEMSTQNPGRSDLSEMYFDHSEEIDHQQNYGSTTSSDIDGLTTLKSLSDELPYSEINPLAEGTDRVNDKKLTGQASNVQERVTLNSKDPIDLFEESNIEKREDMPLTNSVLDKELLEGVKDQGGGPEPGRHKKPIRGVNACPVEEEFVAPYWANNTRGETLALLNLYPFEQYIQWERCKYEHRQMYCREGCRCEQQFRLHKLLAFDPSNECKGIFSDWFRFPSCCVCKCYDLPEELLMPAPRKSARKLDKDDLHQQNIEYDEEADDDLDYDNHSSFTELNEDEGEEIDVDEEDIQINEDGEEKANTNNNEYGVEEPPSYQRRRTSPRKRPQTYRVRSGARMVNIPPQRRPRLPPRPSSHITSPRASTNKPQAKPFYPQQQESTTLGTVDVATPHYYYNISHYLNVLASSHPFPLSRIPRSNPDG